MARKSQCRGNEDEMDRTRTFNNSVAYIPQVIVPVARHTTSTARRIVGPTKGEESRSLPVYTYHQLSRVDCEVEVLEWDRLRRVSREYETFIGLHC